MLFIFIEYFLHFSAPTRELVMQIAENLRLLCAGTELEVSALFCSDFRQSRQKRKFNEEKLKELQNGSNIIVS